MSPFGLGNFSLIGAGQEDRVERKVPLLIIAPERKVLRHGGKIIEKYWVWFVNSCKANFESKKGGSDPEPEGTGGSLPPFLRFSPRPRLRFRVCYLFALKCLRSGACGEPYGEPLGKPPMHGFPVTFEFRPNEIVTR